MKFYFGKYNGQSVDDVYKSDIDYCRWFVKTFPESKTTEYIFGIEKSSRGIYDMTKTSGPLFWFGKYKRTPINEVLVKDIIYCIRYVQSNPTTSTASYIMKRREFIDYVNNPINKRVIK